MRPASTLEGIGALDVTFVPEDPPRRSAFYYYRRPGANIASGGPGAPDDPTFDHKLEVVLPAGASVRRRLVPARRLSVADALRVLSNAETDGGSLSAVGWSRALTAGLVLLSRGRLFPAVSPNGYDMWSAGPLDPADRLLLAELAAAFPPEAHAVAVPGSVPLAMASPQHLVRALWDALVDTLVRTQAAETVARSPLFAAADPQPAGELRDWLDDASVGFDDGADVALRVEIGPDPDLARAVVQLSSRVDPSLVVDAGTIFTAPPTLVSRFGDDVEADLLRALRRGARAWPPLDTLLHQRAPDALELGEDELADLLGEAATTLAGAGLPVLWPAGMVTDGVRLQASLTPQRGKVDGAAGFDLASLVTFRWQAMLDGQALTEEEIDLLAEAKRGLVRLRGKFVVADPELIKRLRDRRQRKLSAIEALAASLSGSIEIDSERFEVSGGGALAELVARLSDADGINTAGQDDARPPGLIADLRPYQR
ncbi:MAG: SNF2 helicase-associated domain-containing protein, partial [Acidimicrobiales bacterium]